MYFLRNTVALPPRWVAAAAAADDDEGADDCGKIHAALTLTRVTRASVKVAHTEQTDRLTHSQTLSERERSDSLYTRGIKGPRPRSRS